MRRADEAGLHVSEIVQDCISRLQSRYRVVAALLAGSAANAPDRALDVDLCVLVHDEVLRQGHLRIGDTPVDVFVCGIERTRRELERGLQQYLVVLFASGRYVWGERGTVENLQRLAQRIIAQPAPSPSAAAEFTLRLRPYSLLHKLEDIVATDRTTAGVILGALVQASLDAFFGLNGIWTTGMRDKMQVVAAHSPAAAAALAHVLAIAPDAVAGQIHLVREMVHLLVGPESSLDEEWA